MDLLKRYLKEVKKHLPRKESQEILLELQSSIMDEFESTAQTERDMEDIILSMGSPVEIGKRYQSKPFLSKQIEPLYFLLLKIISLAITIGLTVATITQLVFSGEEFSAVTVLIELAEMIPSLLMAIVSAVGMVTIIMFIADKYIKIPEKEFKVHELPKLSEPEYEISKEEMYVSIAGGIIFLIIINFINVEMIVDGVPIFADLSTARIIASIFIIIEMLTTILVMVNKTNLKVKKITFVVRHLLSASFLWYLTVIDIFHPEQTVLPNFMSYLLKVVFLGLAIFVATNLRKVKEAS